VRARATFVLAALLALATPASADDARPVSFRGMTLPAALERLRDGGLPILFSSDLVRNDMIVATEPTGRWPNEVLEQLLAPHGLRATAGPSGALLVVPGPPSGSIEGTVRLAHGGPLPGVHVVLGETSVAATTDSKGRFRLGPLPEGVYRLDTARAGFLSRKLENIRVKAAMVTRIGVDLDPRYASSEEVIVRASGEGRTRPEMRETIDPVEGESLPQVAHDSLSGIGRVPGVVATEGAAGWSVRGGASREAKIVLDGLELYAPYHLKEVGGPISIVDSRDVGGFGLLSGAFPAEYGGQMSAVVEMRTVEPTADERTALSWSSEDAKASSQGAFGDNLRWFVSGRRGDPSKLLDALGADPAYQPSYWDFLAKAEYRLGASAKVSVHLLSGDDAAKGTDENDVIHTLDEPGTFLSHNSNRYAWVSLESPLTQHLFVETVVSTGKVASDRTGSNPLLLDVEDLRSTRVFGVKQDWLFQAKRHGLKWGFDLKELRTDYAYATTPAPGASDPAPSALSLAPSGRDIGVYAADRVDLSSAARVEMGLRYDAQSYLQGGGTLSPRVNAVYALSDRTAVKLGWGIFYQPQRTDELQVEDGVTTFYAPERAEHRVLSIEHERQDGLRLRVSVYQKRMTDLHPRYENLFDPFGFFPEAAFDRVEVDPDQARADGLEVAVAGPVGGRFAWWGSYALSRAEDRVDSTWVPRSWDQTQALNAGVRFKIAEHWALSFTGTHHSGRPTTPVTATATQNPDGSFDITPTIGARNSERLPSYHRIDARIGRSFAIRTTRLEASLTVSNLFDRANPGGVSGFDYEPHPDGTVTVHPQLRDGLPRLVSAGLDWKF
jgi:hypothetical protein